MKVHEQNEPEFKPVTVTLETKDELTAFLALVNVNQPGLERFTNENFPELSIPVKGKDLITDIGRTFRQEDYIEIVKLASRFY